MIKKSEIETFGVDELIAKINEMKEEMKRLTITNNVGNLTQTHKRKDVKQAIARMQTRLFQLQTTESTT